ncbi:MAG: bifunctional ADP-dependent (S)-NAD(P)H-hydrate dehydratase/NAD(P)H-hydrate epimerase [Bacteroidetes bacterium GWA2_30_7]|nr:MAG: bifunctional ADP-dependent (S)-NAD(P)H-hydrate dehydratase/NAD(P)H-hydrate epimerase [Bacteroidetes bacterium GWA2_30_7]
MKILNKEQILEADKFTIQNEPVLSIDLMERASEKCCKWIRKNIYFDSKIIIFCGIGNNGGDGLAIARQLKEFKKEVYIFPDKDNYSEDFKTNFEKLSKANISIKTIRNINSIKEINPKDVIIDAIFGSGLNRPVNGIYGETINKINKSGCKIISIDIPSGLFCDSNSTSENIIKADYTLTFQFPKLSFLFSENEQYTGTWKVLDIGLHKEFIVHVKTSNYYITKAEISNKIITRKKFSHKGNFGHALLIAGSFGKMGAAVLASKSCLKSGVGLLTTHIPKVGYDIMQTSIPEAMVSVSNSKNEITSFPHLEKFSAIAIGPGIGTSKITQIELKKFLELCKKPLVLDADALNIISKNKTLLNFLPENTILTPHPREFDRLTKKHESGYERYLSQIEFSKKFNVIVILKGANTSISCPDGICYFNSTGNPGMSTAGSGDVLTGIILSLLSQGYSPVNSAITGVYIHGLAGDIACKNESYESLIAGDIINNLGKAFKEFRI